jgi:large subunit ribosomal protein L44e
MILPKTRKRYCKYCKKHTLHKIVLVSSGHKRGAMRKGSKERARLRGRVRGYGNMGRWSKPAVTKFKRKTKGTKKTNIMYTCTVCNKSILQSKGKRVSKVQIKEK